MQGKLAAYKEQKLTISQKIKLGRQIYQFKRIDIIWFIEHLNPKDQNYVLKKILKRKSIDKDTLVEAISIANKLKPQEPGLTRTITKAIKRYFDLYFYNDPAERKKRSYYDQIVLRAMEEVRLF